MTAARVVRSSSWILDARDVRCAYRFAFVPGFRYKSCGFRPVAKAIPDAHHILRGGSCYDDAQFMHRAYIYRPISRGSNLGLRPVAKANL